VFRAIAFEAGAAGHELRAILGETGVPLEAVGLTTGGAADRLAHLLEARFGPRQEDES
jgi:hypothetical protein